MNEKQYDNIAVTNSPLVGSGPCTARRRETDDCTVEDTANRHTSAPAVCTRH